MRGLSEAVTLEARNVDRRDEQRSFEHGDVRLAQAARCDDRSNGVPAGVAVVERHEAPCRHGLLPNGHYIAYVVSGRFHVRMDDGRELDLGPGDAHVVGPGHDAWVVGGEPCVTIDFIPAGADAGDRLSSARPEQPRQ